MKRKQIHEEYHYGAKLQKRIISENNFTYRNIIEVLKTSLGGKKNVLDIGCGVGTISFYLASKGLLVKGVDISSIAVNVARKNSRSLGIDSKTIFITSDFPRHEIKDTFDLIICSEVLEHLPDDKKAIRNIKKALKKDGTVFFSVPSNNAPLYRWGFLKEFDRRVGHLRRYDRKSIRKLLKDYGFKVYYEREDEGFLRNLLFTNKSFGRIVKFIKGPLSDIFTVFDRLTLPIFGASQIIIMAKK